MARKLSVLPQKIKKTLYVDSEESALSICCGDRIGILFMPESTEGISEGQTTAMSGKND